MAKIIFICFRLSIMRISFCGLKENILYGYQAINDVQRDFPNGLRSNTYYDIFENEKDQKTKVKLEYGISKTRNRVDQMLRYGYLEKDAVEIAVKETGVANCGEQAILVSKKLDKQGIKNKIVQMDVCMNGNYHYVTGGHTFCLIGTSDDMNVLDPETWGEEAVVVDMWSGIVKKASEALKFFSGFVVPKKDEHIEFSSKTCY